MIYSITEAAAPDIIMEFGFDKADDYEEVEKLVLDIYKDMRKVMDELPSFYALKTKEYPPAKDKKGYTKAMDKLESRIKKSGPKFDLSTRAVYYINISKTTPKELMNILGKVVASHGFKNMPSSGNGFKDFFKSFHMYKQISEDVMAICDLSVLYTSNYNTPSYYDKLTFCITAISTSDKNLKKLNLLKEASIRSHVNNMEDAVHGSAKSTESMLRQIEQYQKQTEENLAKIGELNEKNRRKIDELFKQLSHENCGFFSDVNLI